jgi:hypothetical protein
MKSEAMALRDVTGVHLESGSELESRVTMTRLVALGLLAFAVKKKRGGERFLTIESRDAFWSLEVPRKGVRDAARFRGAVEDQVRKASA